MAGLLGVGELGKPDGDLVVPGAGSVEQTSYHFYNDKLVRVSVQIALPVGADSKAAVERISEIVAQKYRDNTTGRDIPRYNGISIKVVVMPKDPKDPANGTEVATVQYLNGKLLSSLENRERDQRKADARKAVDAMGLGDVL